MGVIHLGEEKEEKQRREKTALALQVACWSLSKACTQNCFAPSKVLNSRVWFLPYFFQQQQGRVPYLYESLRGSWGAGNAGWGHRGLQWHRWAPSGRRQTARRPLRREGEAVRVGSAVSSAAARALPRPGTETFQLLLFQKLGKDKKGLTDSPGRWEPFIYPQSRHSRSSNQPPPCSLASRLEHWFIGQKELFYESSCLPAYITQGM